MDSEDVLLANTVELQERIICTKLLQHTNHGKVRVTHHTDMQLYHMLSSLTHTSQHPNKHTHAAYTLVHTHIRTYIICVSTCTKSHIYMNVHIHRYKLCALYHPHIHHNTTYRHTYTMYTHTRTHACTQPTKMNHTEMGHPYSSLQYGCHDCRSSHDSSLNSDLTLARHLLTFSHG